MFRIGTTPDIKSKVTEMADFMEWMCIISETQTYSFNELKSIWMVELDDPDASGDDVFDARLDGLMCELKRRETFCNGHYPFSLGSNHLSYSKKDGIVNTIYIYLLLTTRLNMNSSKTVGGIDGTALFEELCAIVAKSYFGDRSDSFVFGTGASDAGRKLEDRFNDMTKRLGEGGIFVKPETSTGREKDLNLDVVVYKPFADKRVGKLVGLGQCKTGTNWEEMTTQLQPQTIFLYSNSSLRVEPIRMFFVSEACENKWDIYTSEAGIFFDRNRIMDYLPENIDADLFAKIKRWTEMSIERIDKVFLT